MNFNNFEDNSECTVTVTNEVTSVQLPPFVRVIIDCKKVYDDRFDVILNSPPPFKNLVWLVIERPPTTIFKVAAGVLFGNMIQIYSPYLRTIIDSSLIGTFLYQDMLSFHMGTDKVSFYNNLQFGHYDEAFNKILKDCNLPYYYKYGRRIEI